MAADKDTSRKLRHTNILGGLILLAIVLTYIPGPNEPVAIAHALITILLVIWCILGWVLQSDIKSFGHPVWMNIISLTVGILLFIFVSLPSIWPNLSFMKNQNDLFSNIAMAGFGVAAFLLYMLNNELHIALGHKGKWLVAGKNFNGSNSSRSCRCFVFLCTIHLVISCMYPLLYTEPLVLCVLSAIFSLAGIICSLLLFFGNRKDDSCKKLNYIFIGTMIISIVDIFMGCSPYIFQSYSWALSLINALNIFFFAASICFVVFLDNELGGGLIIDERFPVDNSIDYKKLISQILSSQGNTIDNPEISQEVSSDDFRKRKSEGDLSIPKEGNNISENLNLPPLPLEYLQKRKTSP